MKILAIVCSLVLALGLAGCGSGSGGPDTAAKPSASPTPTATLPAKPANWNEATPEAAADFVGYWIDIQNYGGPSMKSTSFPGKITLLHRR